MLTLGIIVVVMVLAVFVAKHDFNGHKWVYTGTGERTCTRCGTAQHIEFDGLTYLEWVNDNKGGFIKCPKKKVNDNESTN